MSSRVFPDNKLDDSAEAGRKGAGTLNVILALPKRKRPPTEAALAGNLVAKAGGGGINGARTQRPLPPALELKPGHFPNPVSRVGNRPVPKPRLAFSV
jgi:hypothetical protein